MGFKGHLRRAYYYKCVAPENVHPLNFQGVVSEGILWSGSEEDTLCSSRKYPYTTVLPPCKDIRISKVMEGLRSVYFLAPEYSQPVKGGAKQVRHQGD